MKKRSNEGAIKELGMANGLTLMANGLISMVNGLTSMVNGLTLTVAMMFFGLTALAAPAQVQPQAQAAEQVAISIKIIHATKGTRHIDPKLKAISAQFKNLAFTSYALLDEATFRLDLNASGKMEFPDKRWLQVTPRAVDANNVIKIDLAVKKIKFTTTARIPAGGMLTIGGPKYTTGSLLLVLTARYPAPRAQ